MSEKDVISAVDKQGRIVTRKLVELSEAVATMAEDLAAIKRDLAAGGETPPKVPPTPPPPPGPPTKPPPEPGTFVWEHPGLFHRQTHAEPFRLLDIPLDELPGGRFHRVVLTARLVTAPWNPSAPDALHGVAWLLWQGMSGSVFIANARGPERNLFRVATRFPAAGGQPDGHGDSSAATGSWPDRDQVGRKDLHLMWNSGRVSGFVGLPDDALALASEQFPASVIDTNARSGSQGPGWVLGFGNKPQGNEVPWIGAELHDLRVELHPASRGE